MCVAQATDEDKAEATAAAEAEAVDEDKRVDEAASWVLLGYLQTEEQCRTYCVCNMISGSRQHA